MYYEVLIYNIVVQSGLFHCKIKAKYKRKNHVYNEDSPTNINSLKFSGYFRERSAHMQTRIIRKYSECTVCVT